VCRYFSMSNGALFRDLVLAMIALLDGSNAVKGPWH